MKVIFICGPFRAATPWLVEQNVRRAEELALEVWRAGFAALCPHTNTRHFNGAADDAVWLAGAIELMRRCDAVLVVDSPATALSEGTATEIHEAWRSGLPVFYSLDELRKWSGA